MQLQLAEMVSTIIYSIIGCVIFIATYLVFEKFSPFSVKKEILEDQNIALGIIMGSVVIGLSVIISAAIR